MIKTFQLERWLNPTVLSMQAYSVADATDMVKLDAMENPYAMPKVLQTEWLKVLQHVAINRYPDPDAKALKKTLRAHLKISDEFDILFGNGSDEIIQLLMLAIPRQQTILYPEPTFVMYKLLGKMLGLNCCGVSLNNHFHLDQTTFLQAIETNNPQLIFISQPNNPTGNLFEQSVLESIIEKTSGLVVIDEAYQAFTKQDALTWALRYPNVVILRTFSKIGLAGLRLGFLIGDQKIIHELNKIRLPYNINSLTQAIVTFALQHYAEFALQAEKICHGRAVLSHALQQIDGVDVFPSETNFLLLRTKKSAEKIFSTLVARKILIKKLHGAHDLLQNCLRVTVGTPQENQQFLREFNTILSSDL